MSGYLSKPPCGVQIDWSNPLTRGLVGCWLFNEGAGLRANDLSGNNNRGVLTNFEPLSSTSGWNDNGLTFNGVGNYVDAGNGASLNITNAITVSAWVKIPNNPAAVNVIVGRWGSGGVGNAAWGFQVTTTGRIGFETYDGSAIGSISGTNALSLGVFNHVVVVYSGGTSGTNGYLYINGVQDNIGTINKIIQSSNYKVSIGSQNGASTTSIFSGSIDKVRIWNRALFANEIQALYIQPYNMFKFMPQSIAWKGT